MSEYAIKHQHFYPIFIKIAIFKNNREITFPTFSKKRNFLTKES